jgi:hypothetical protein
MSTVRYAMLCEDCGARSPEYYAWWSCRECMNDVCDACIVPGTQDSETGRAFCKACKAEAERPWLQDCLECLSPCDGGRDNLGTCGSERCRARAMQADAQEYGGGE